MTFYRGLSGYVTLGGNVSSQSGVTVNGAQSAGATTISFDGNSGSPLAGWLAPGDQFTIAGETGTPTHTVNNAAGVLAVVSQLNGVTFTPAIASGGVADNAVVTILANAVAQVIQWSFNATIEELEVTVMGDPWKSVVGGNAQWKGQVGVRLDYGDLRQKALVDRLIGASPASAAVYLTLGVNQGGGLAEQFEGAACLYSVQVQSQLGQIVGATFDFSGSFV